MDPGANIFFGMVTDPAMGDEVRITIIATGFPSSDVLVNAREEELASLVAGTSFGEHDPDIDLPPFLRKSTNLARRRLTSRLNGL